jgi:copper chaperone
MIELNIPALSCGHCVKAVTEAAHEVDAKAQVQVDLAAKQVRVQTSAPSAAIVAALVDAGYEPEALSQG